MRVLFLTHRLPYAANRGDRIRALNMLRALAGHVDVDLVSLVHDREERDHVGDLEALVSSAAVAPVSKLRGYSRVLGVLPTTGTITHALLDAPDVRTVCHRLVQERRPDVVLAYCSSMARFAMEPPLESIPFVLDMIDVDSEKWRALGQAGPLHKRWIYRIEADRLSAFEAAAARRARTVLVVNERERDALHRLEPTADIRIVPNGVSLDEFRPPSAPSTEQRVTFCGVMSYAPNEEAALWFARSVWPVVRARNPNAQLSIVGSSPTPAVRRLSDTDSSIEVTGAVPDVRPYLWRASVSVAPLFVARGVQNKVLEAVVAGLPCVITQAVRDGLPSQILPACTLATDADAFAAAVIALLTLQPEERRAMAARAKAESLSWSNQLAPLVSILEAAAGVPTHATPALSAF